MADIKSLLIGIDAFKLEVEKEFGAFEGNRHKTSELVEKVASLEGEEYKVLFDDALDCILISKFRAGIMEAWSGTMFCLQTLAIENCETIRAKHNNFPVIFEDLQDDIADNQLLTFLKGTGLITRQRHKNLTGLLNKRNQACHPSADDITQVEAIAFVHDVIKQINGVRSREKP